jgi:hypothetical protein
MAKKITIDFSKTEERSSWNTRKMPIGLYRMRIASVQQTEAKDGTPMIVYGLQPTSQQFRTRLLPFYCKLQPNQLWKLRDILVAAGQKVPQRAIKLDPEAIVGAVISAEVEDDLYNGVERSTLTGVYSAEFTADMEDPTQGSDSEEDSSSSSEDPSSYDESDSDDYEDDEYDEEDYDDSDDFDDEESDLNDEFPEDDEPATSDNDGDAEGDDFDDEDDDFADEGEDEDPEPAPRSVTKAPAKRRTIKRSPRKAAK